MRAIRARYERGRLIWVDAPPRCERCDVLVIFPFDVEERPKEELESKAFSPSDILQLESLVEWGGNALEDEGRIYNE